MWCYHTDSDSDLDCHLVSSTPRGGEMPSLSSLMETWCWVFIASTRELQNDRTLYGCLSDMTNASRWKWINRAAPLGSLPSRQGLAIIHQSSALDAFPPCFCGVFHWLVLWHHPKGYKRGCIFEPWGTYLLVSQVNTLQEAEGCSYSLESEPSQCLVTASSWSEVFLSLNVHLLHWARLKHQHSLNTAINRLGS